MTFDRLGGGGKVILVVFVGSLRSVSFLVFPSLSRGHFRSKLFTSVVSSTSGFVDGLKAVSRLILTGSLIGFLIFFISPNTRGST